MKNYLLFIILMISKQFIFSQDLSLGLTPNDLSEKKMQPLAKPSYLQAVTDPSFGTTIRRISEAEPGEIIKPMYSTIQAWNADESQMILYYRGKGHLLLDGMNYRIIRTMTDVNPSDIEELFWDTIDPKILYYINKTDRNLIRYNVETKAKEVLADLASLVNCNEVLESGNDVQMMSADSDIIGFRCGNSSTYYYKISTGTITEFNISENTINYTAAMPGPSGKLFFHEKKVYDDQGNFVRDLNIAKTEHSSLGKLENGNDAYFQVSFKAKSEPCSGNLVAHDMVTGDCYSIISEDKGYNYSQNGTHVSALAYKNTSGNWLVASMIGKNEDGQSLLDQELVLVKADPSNFEVYRIGHHRSDEREFDYWGEPHATISPSGTRVLFGSDWSGAEDGKSVDAYVVELPAFSATLSSSEIKKSEEKFEIYPNPVSTSGVLNFITDSRKPDAFTFTLYDLKGQKLFSEKLEITNKFSLNDYSLSSGIYFYKIKSIEGQSAGSLILN